MAKAPWAKQIVRRLDKTQNISLTHTISFSFSLSHFSSLQQYMPTVSCWLGQRWKLLLCQTMSSVLLVNEKIYEPLSLLGHKWWLECTRSLPCAWRCWPRLIIISERVITLSLCTANGLVLVFLQLPFTLHSFSLSLSHPSSLQTKWQQCRVALFNGEPAHCVRPLSSLLVKQIYVPFLNWGTVIIALTSVRAISPFLPVWHCLAVWVWSERQTVPSYAWGS